MADRLIVTVMTADERQAELITSNEAVFAVQETLERLGLEPGVASQTRTMDIADYEASGFEGLGLDKMIGNAIAIRLKRARRKVDGKIL